MNKKYYIALGFAVVLVIAGLAMALPSKPHDSIADGGQVVGAAASPESVLGGNPNTTAVVAPEGVESGNGVTTNWFKGTIPAGQYQASFRNRSGKTMYVFVEEIRTTGAASSSQRIIAGTSTVPTVNPYLNPGSNGLNGTTSLAIVPLATSSTATTSSSYAVPPAGQFQKPARLADGEYFNIAILQGLTGIPSAGCNEASAASCDSATSSTRGFNVNWKIRYFFE